MNLIGRTHEAPEFSAPNLPRQVFWLVRFRGLPIAEATVTLSGEKTAPSGGGGLTVMGSLPIFTGFPILSKRAPKHQ
jgi:hypothetical protein